MAKKKKDIAEQTASSPAEGSYIPALDDEKYDVNTTAEKVYKRDWLIRIIAIILAVLLLLLGIGYGCVAVINAGGRFTVSVNGNIYGIQIADNPEFKNPGLVLHGKQVENMDNITEKWLLNQGNELGEKDKVYKSFDAMDEVYGNHNGTNYLAYTFLVRNAGEEVGEKDATVNYVATLKIVSQSVGKKTQALDEDALHVSDAIRVKVFINGKATNYAAPPKMTNRKMETFAADKNFISNDVIMEYKKTGFEVGDVDRYTVIVWLEGEDPECINDIMGGDLKLKMDLEVLGESAVDVQS